jgi:hypothetical protein
MFRGIHADGWAGPEIVTTIEARPDDGELVLTGTINRRSSTRLEVFVDGHPRDSRMLKLGSTFEIRITVERLASGPHEVRVTSSSWFVADDFLHNGDFRPLAFQVVKLAFEPAAR